jgi:HSP20 family protein
MTETHEITSRPAQEAQIFSRPGESDVVLLPPVDIFEDAEGIVLQMDMPGVSKDRLNIQADRNTLLVEGSAKIDMVKGMEALYADVRSSDYRRSFTLTSELDSEKIDANLKDGVLTVRIPKRAELRPRKVEVRTG